MKNKKIFKILVTVFVLICNIGQAQNVEVEIKTSAQCMECKENIENALIIQKGVKHAELDLESSIVKVVYNERKTSPSAAIVLDLPDHPTCSPKIIDALYCRHIALMEDVRSINDLMLLQISWRVV